MLNSHVRYVYKLTPLLLTVFGWTTSPYHWFYANIIINALINVFKKMISVNRNFSAITIPP